MPKVAGLPNENCVKVRALAFDASVFRALSCESGAGGVFGFTLWHFVGFEHLSFDFAKSKTEERKRIMNDGIEKGQQSAEGPRVRGRCVEE